MAYNAVLINNTYIPKNAGGKDEIIINANNITISFFVDIVYNRFALMSV